MADQIENQEVEANDEQVAQKSDEKVTCYLSKQVVSISDTVELKYNDQGTYRVLASLVKF